MLFWILKNWSKHLIISGKCSFFLVNILNLQKPSVNDGFCVLHDGLSQMKKYLYEKISPQTAIAILKKKGLEINEQQAEEILELLYILAILEVEQAMKKP